MTYMKTLIAYYSFTNNNELLAKAIQKKLNCDIYRIEEPTKRTGFRIMLDLILKRTPKIKPHPYSISAYEQCILMAPVWAGKVASPLRTFLLQEKNHINRYSFITICGGAPQQREKLIADLSELVGQRPTSVQELSINDLLPEEQKNSKSISGYRVQLRDLDKFNSTIDDFLKGLEAPFQVKPAVV